MGDDTSDSATIEAQGPSPERRIDELLDEVRVTYVAGRDVRCPECGLRIRVRAVLSGE